VLRVALDRAVAAGATSMAEFALRMVARYLDRTPEHDRIDALRHLPREDDTRVYEADREALRRQIGRMRDGALRLPADIEEAWILALPQPWQSDALDALAARLGTLAVPAPDGHGFVGGVGRYMQAGGRVLQALQPILEDGMLNQDDAAHLPEAAAALRAHMRDTAALLARIETLQEQIGAGEKTGAAELVLRAVPGRAA